MRKPLYLMFVLVFIAIAASASAGDRVCPADRAAAHGMSPFELFHDAMAPAWHKAWPDKDYDALIAVGADFKKLFVGISKLDPKHSMKYRRELFEKHRNEFADLVDRYAEAAENGDKEKVYELMPELHDAFEMTASTALPVSFPLIDGIVITSNVIGDVHLPANNTKGLIGSTNTLANKLASFSEEDIPPDLAEVKDEVIDAIAEMKKVVAGLQECCEKNDFEAYSKEYNALQKQLEDFVAKYI